MREFLEALKSPGVNLWRPNEYERAKLAIEPGGYGLGKDFLRHFLPPHTVSSNSTLQTAITAYQAMNEITTDVDPGMVTEIGLRIPTDLPEEQFFAIGRTLSRIERGMQWAIGDWYNAIQGDKWAACERAGLHFKTARNYAWVAMQFPLAIRMTGATFDHHRKLAIQELTDEQRCELLEKSSKNSLSLAALTRERDKLLGKPERVPVQNFSDQVQAVLNQLPASAALQRGAAVSLMHAGRNTLQLCR